MHMRMEGGKAWTRRIMHSFRKSATIFCQRPVFLFKASIYFHDWRSRMDWNCG